MIIILKKIIKTLTHLICRLFSARPPRGIWPQQLCYIWPWWWFCTPQKSSGLSPARTGWRKLLFPWPSLSVLHSFHIVSGAEINQPSGLVEAEFTHLANTIRLTRLTRIRTSFRACAVDLPSAMLRNSKTASYRTKQDTRARALHSRSKDAYFATV